MTVWKKLGSGSFVACATIQLASFERPNGPVRGDIRAAAAVMVVLTYASLREGDTQGAYFEHTGRAVAEAHCLPYVSTPASALEIEAES